MAAGMGMPGAAAGCRPAPVPPRAEDKLAGSIASLRSPRGAALLILLPALVLGGGWFAWDSLRPAATLEEGSLPISRRRPAPPPAVSAAPATPPAAARLRCAPHGLHRAPRGDRTAPRSDPRHPRAVRQPDPDAHHGLRHQPRCRGPGLRRARPRPGRAEPGHYASNLAGSRYFVARAPRKGPRSVLRCARVSTRSSRRAGSTPSWRGSTTSRCWP